jgi:DNA-binding NarL/FixJ family response regulator
MYQAKFNLVFDNLPPRQKEVLLKLLAGEVDEAIAKSLNIEKSTVRKHIEKIHKAFELKNDFSDERRSTRLDLLLLFAKYKPELVRGEFPAIRRAIAASRISTTPTVR